MITRREPRSRQQRPDWSQTMRTFSIPAEHRSSSLQQVFRQAARGRANDCPDAEHDRPSLTPALATVGAIVAQSLRNSQRPEHAQHAIEGRLLALGRAHDLLLHASWTSADLGAVVRRAIEAFESPDQPKFSISGPEIRMTSGAVIAVAMMLNELCTNTTKFGALSVPEGRVDIIWTLDAQTQRLHLTWTEKNGPAVHPPEKRSFGTRLIQTLGKQLKGDALLAYESAGFVYTLDVPIASVTSSAA